MSAHASHPFDRYAAYVDVAALKAASVMPLRKSVRVNTLKMSVEEFQSRAERKHWKLEPVPWCKEGFFVDRVDREEAIGKDLLHLLGLIYIQEAASMLPVALLDPKPSENILDMSAAPGSKSTQIAACLQQQGVLISNDVQEKRLWTLRTALHRSGVLSDIVTKKVGQWFMKHMTEVFDRVLCDAPCTAQGTLRKDPTALTYTSEAAIAKCAKLQGELLEAAVHATKIGGRIVYSTCTLTPEENESVVRGVVERCGGTVEVVDPAELGSKALGGESWGLEKAARDSLRVQEGKNETFPMLRLWPQTFDTEGFFCAVLQKNARTREPVRYDPVQLPGKLVHRAEQHALVKRLEEYYGVSLVYDGEQIFDRGDDFLLTSHAAAEFYLPVAAYGFGIPFGRKNRDGSIRISHEMAILRGYQAKQHIFGISDDELPMILSGRDIPCDASLEGHLLLLYDGLCIGRGRAVKGTLRNHLDRWMVQQFQ